LQAAGVSTTAAELEEWVRREREAVTAHLVDTLVADPEVSRGLKTLSERYRLALVSSSAAPRVDACLDATGLAEFFPPELRFSAEDSLAEPISKPDPAIYRHALAALGCAPHQALAIEDSPSGTRSAVGAGIPTVGIVQFVPSAEQGAARRELRAAGAGTVVGSWRELEVLL
jgi:beta-phosphoglucomutase-like phosphatase (HAD superfamily)